MSVVEKFKNDLRALSEQLRIFFFENEIQNVLGVHSPIYIIIKPTEYNNNRHVTYTWQTEV